MPKPVKILKVKRKGNRPATDFMVTLTETILDQGVSINVNDGVSIVLEGTIVRIADPAESNYVDNDFTIKIVKGSLTKV